MQLSVTHLFILHSVLVKDITCNFDQAQGSSRNVAIRKTKAARLYIDEKMQY